MDEIFDRLKAVKIPRKYLVVGLILSEILGILVLVWFLRVPLTQKFLVTPPKAYSVISMNPKTRYLLKQGDYLTGKAIPNTKVIILLTPTNKKTILRSTADGSWYYQIPNNLNIQKYHFSVINFDKNNKLAFLKTYRFRVETNSRLNSFLKRFQEMMPKALAQESEESFSIDFGEKFGNWVQGLNSLGIYVYCETNGEDSYCQDSADVFLTDYDGILNRCDELNKQCILGHRSDGDLIENSKKSSQDFIDRVIQKTDESNYNITVLLDYFPELVDGDYFEKIRKQQKKGGSYRNDISDSELANLIQSVVNDLGWEKAKYEENFGDPVKTLMTLSDPILGTKAVVKYFEKGGYDKLTIDEQTDFLLAVAFLPIPAKAGKAIIGVSRSVDEMVAAGKLVRQEVKNSSSIPVSQIRNIFSPEELVQLQKAADSGANALAKTKLPSNLPYLTEKLPDFYLYGISKQFFNENILPLVSKRQVYTAPTETTEAVFKNLDQTLHELEKIYGKRFYVYEPKYYENNPYDEFGFSFDSILRQGKTVIIDDEPFAQIASTPETGAFTIGQLVVMAHKNWVDDQAGFIFYSHELAHTLRQHAKDFVYRGASTKDKVCHAFFELGTDRIATYATLNKRGFSVKDTSESTLSIMEFFGPGGYSTNFSNEHRLISTFKNQNPITEFHIMNLAIHGQCDVFLSAMLESGFNLIPDKNNLTQQFIDLVRKNFNIDLNAVKVIIPSGALANYADDVNIFPSVDLSDIFDVESSGNQFSIQIISSNITDQIINITSIVSNNGQLTENSGLITRWYLEDINQNRTLLEEKAETCTSGCIVALPSINPGSYVLIVDLIQNDTGEILASNSTPLEIPENQSSDTTPIVEAGSETIPLSSQLSCSYTEWSDVEPYSCQDGFACYNDWYLDEGTSCQPASRNPHYHCIESVLCANATQGDATRSGD